MRVFIGFLIPERIRAPITSVQKKLEGMPIKCKLVEPENLHVSLSFLGEIGEDGLKKTVTELSDICEDCSEFELKIGGIKLIPNEKYIRVVMLDVEDDSGELDRICESIGDEIGGSMNPPHITLCRVRKVFDKERFIEEVNGLKLTDDLSFKVSSISIIKSELSPTGPEYSEVYQGKL